jgi:hypothetical protein
MSDYENKWKYGSFNCVKCMHIMCGHMKHRKTKAEANNKYLWVVEIGVYVISYYILLLF